MKLWYRISWFVPYSFFWYVFLHCCNVISLISIVLILVCVTNGYLIFTKFHLSYYILNRYESWTINISCLSNAPLEKCLVPFQMLPLNSFFQKWKSFLRDVFCKISNIYIFICSWLLPLPPTKSLENGFLSERYNYKFITNYIFCKNYFYVEFLNCRALWLPLRYICASYKMYRYLYHLHGQIILLHINSNVNNGGVHCFRTAEKRSFLLKAWSDLFYINCNVF